MHGSLADIQVHLANTLGLEKPFDDPLIFNLKRFLLVYILPKMVVLVG